jgi:competence protein ComFC
VRFALVVCLLCNKFQEDVLTIADFWWRYERKYSCLHCFSAFEKIEKKKVCLSCFKYCSHEICQDCRRWQKLYPGYKFRNESLYFYNEAMEEFMQKYKFQGDYRLRLVFAREIRRYLKKYKKWLVVPIPISRKRMLLRGFNQVEGLLEASNISFFQVLKKPYDREYQSHKTRGERLQELQSFELMEGGKEKIFQRKVLLVDDIYTTGRTLFHGFDAIREAQPSEVRTFTLAR